MQLDRVVTQIFEMLGEVRLGTIVAVWPGGGVSAHRDLAFRYRTLPNGERETPIVTFVATGHAVSLPDIRERIKRAAATANE